MFLELDRNEACNDQINSTVVSIQVCNYVHVVKQARNVLAKSATIATRWGQRIELNSIETKRETKTKYRKGKLTLLFHVVPLGYPSASKAGTRSSRQSLFHIKCIVINYYIKFVT